MRLDVVKYWHSCCCHTTEGIDMKDTYNTTCCYCCCKSSKTGVAIPTATLATVVAVVTAATTADIAIEWAIAYCAFTCLLYT
eukprot:1257-Heterococcus_DN1.PRE.3